ncbi:TRAP transporter large permease [Yoonia sp. GPGPB17]|uniref:TRAP transporter large permease n=1 Tax=Yoonia sp. GPGPB17 TaxID=3026147 RepID=UPI0030BCF1FB
MLLWFLPLFLILIMIGLPVVFALLASPFALIMLEGDNRNVVAGLYRNLYNGMDSFPLMALPFFMLAGEIMNRGGITLRLVEFSQAFMGHLRGGLAHVNILSSMLFAGLSGSAVADTSALGSTLIPAMEKNGYTRKFAAAITAASSVIGPIIPPSGIMIIYAYVMGESVASLFLAGIVPGIMVGGGLMIMVRLMADRYDLPKAERIVTKNQDITQVEYWVSFVLLRINVAGLLMAIYSGLSTTVGLASFNEAGDKVHSLNLWIVFAGLLVIAHFLLMSYRGRVSHDFRMICKKAIAPLQTPIIILGGILVGVFTPTEASAIAVAYALIVSFFVLRSMNLRDLGEVLTKSALATSAVLLLVGAAVAFKTVVSLSYAPQILSEYILSLSENPLMLLFLINILLFIVGMFLDAGPAIIILGPILGPIFVDLGVHPVHFAIIMSVNLTVGLATPPMGLVLFVASTVSGEKVETISKAILPFLAVEVLVIFLITYIPAISMTVPYLAGFLGCAPEIGFSACISPAPGIN